MPDDAPRKTAPRDVDRRALQRISSRLARAAAPPWLHQEAARRMAERLSVVRRQPATVIDWSGHAGAGHEALATAYPQARRLTVEPDDAARQARRERDRVPWWSPRRWRDAPAELLLPDEVPAAAGDLLWANMSLHLEADPPALMARWHRALAADGFLMFTTLGPGTLESLGALYRGAGWAPAFAPFVDMHDLGDMLVEAGFADPVMDQEVLTLTWPDSDALLGELRALGGNAHPARHRGLRTPRWRAELGARLGVTAAGDGRPRLQFELVYGHAFRVVRGPRVSEQTTVPLDEMRAMMRRARRA